MSSVSNRTRRPGGRPSYASVVCWPHTNRRFVAIPFIWRWLPVWIAEPNPSIAISIRIPQNTPNAVRNVRSRFERSVAQISFHLSRSNTATGPS